MRAVRRAKYAGNPYVPLRADRLRRAVQLDRRGVRVLAGVIRQQHGLSYSYQNLSHLMLRGTRCRADLRSALAKVLNVPEDYLHGRVELPYTPSSFWEKPPADALRYSSLLQRIASALRRDLWKWHGKDKGERAYRSWGGPILDVFDHLSASTTWRQLGVIPVVSPIDNPAVILPQDDAPAVAWLTQMLEPWFEGRAYLHATGIYELVRGLLANPHAMEQPRSGARRLRALKKYAALCRKFARPRMKELAAIAIFGRAIHLPAKRPE